MAGADLDNVTYGEAKMADEILDAEAKVPGSGLALALTWATKTRIGHYSGDGAEAARANYTGRVRYAAQYLEARAAAKALGLT